MCTSLHQALNSAACAGSFKVVSTASRNLLVPGIGGGSGTGGVALLPNGAGGVLARVITPVTALYAIAESSFMPFTIGPKGAGAAWTAAAMRLLRSASSFSTVVGLHSSQT